MQRLVATSAGALATLAAACIVASTAAAAVASTGGPIQLYATAGNGAKHTIVFVGAIGDYGTTLNIDKNGKVNENGNFVKVRLQKGSFELDTTAMAKTMNGGPKVADNATCSAGFSGSAPVKFFNGTGLYKGISGTVTVTLLFGGVGPVYTSGPKKGQCKPQDAKPLAQFGSVTGRGTIHFTP